MFFPAISTVAVIADITAASPSVAMAKYGPRSRRMGRPNSKAQATPSTAPKTSPEPNDQWSCAMAIAVPYVPRP